MLSPSELPCHMWDPVEFFRPPSIFHRYQRCPGRMCVSLSLVAMPHYHLYFPILFPAVGTWLLEIPGGNQHKFFSFLGSPPKFLHPSPRVWPRRYELRVEWPTLWIHQRMKGFPGYRTSSLKTQRVLELVTPGEACPLQCAHSSLSLQRLLLLASFSGRMFISLFSSKIFSVWKKSLLSLGVNYFSSLYLGIHLRRCIPCSSMQSYLGGSIGNQEG